MFSKTGIIIGREYMERVRKKSFLITTLVMPVLMVLLMAVPGIIIAMGGASETRTVYVRDLSGQVGSKLESGDIAVFIPTELPADSVIKLDNVDAVLTIPADIIEKDSRMSLLINGSSSMMLEEHITRKVNDIVEQARIQAEGIEDLAGVLERVASHSTLDTKRADKADDKSQSAMLSYGLGIVMTFLLYMCLLIYGQMVMTSIIEEKGNRVLEVLVGSVSPTQMMLGKICGICLVAVTQILIWGVLIACLSAFVMPMLLPADVTAEATALSNGTLDAASATVDVDLLGIVSLLGNVGYIVGLFALLLLFLVGGFMLFAAIFAAIGSSVDNIQDASQLQSVAVYPVIFGIVFGMLAASDPNSGLAFWTSMIPFTSPMVMMARIPYGIPAWEIVLSAVLLYAGFAFMVWVAAKIFRVGIFMYGKKPTIKDLVRWMRYK